MHTHLYTNKDTMFLHFLAGNIILHARYAVCFQLLYKLQFRCILMLFPMSLECVVTMSIVTLVTTKVKRYRQTA